MLKLKNQADNIYIKNHREMNLITIDTFINVPLLISAGIGLVIFIFSLIIRIKKIAKISFIFYIISALLVAGSVYAYFTKFYYGYVIFMIAIGFVIFAYMLVYAFDNPEKRAAKKAAKKTAESSVTKDANLISKEIVDKLNQEHEEIIDTNKELISKMSTFFSSENSLENYFDYCNDFITQKVKADGCVILVNDNFENTLAVKSFKGTFPPPYKLPDDLPHKPIRVETNLRFASFQLSGNIFGDIFTDGKPAYIPDSVKDIRVYQNGPEDFLKCGSYIFTPIKQQEDILGLIAIARVPGKDPFTPNDFEEAKIIADAISNTMDPLFSFLEYAEHTELNKGGSIAAKYQKDLLPAKLPIIKNLSIGCFSNPAENVCGDFYDILMSRKDHVSFIMSDVAGKGMNSLIVMIMIRAILRLAVHTAQSASTIMSWANRGICFESSKIDHFASVTLINYDASKKEIDVATCGNNPVLIYSASDKSIKQISVPSEPMGVSKDTEYNDKNYKLNSGDIVATCTDGLLESLNENGVQYSIESLKKVIIKNCNANAKDISNKVKDDLKKYCGLAQQYDDQSLLVIKIQ